MTEPQPRHDARWGFALCVALGLAYLATLSPGIRVESDAGELQFTGYVLGTAHPTGYPLYTVIAWAFTHALPLGSVAWRANLLTALFAALAVGALFAALRQLAVPRPAAAAAAAGFGLLPAWWRYAVMAEVYSLHILLMGGIWWALFAWRRGGRRGWLWAAIALYGLALGHHLLIGLCLPGIAWLVLSQDRRALFQPATLLWGLAWMGLGLGQYGYLAWRFADPDAAFAFRDSASPAVLWDYMTGSVFHDYLGNPDGGLAARAGAILGRAGGQTAAACLLGLAAPALLRDRGAGGALGLTAAAHIGFALVYGIEDIEPYLFPAAWVGAVAGGAGLQSLARRLAALPGGALATTGLMLVGPVWMASGNGDAALPVQARADAAWVQRVTDAAGAEAVFVVEDWEAAVALWAHHYTEGGRERDLWVYPARPVPDQIQRVRAYAAGRGALRVAEQRDELPEGLTVYCVGPAWIRALRDAGPLTPAAPGLMRVP